MFESASKRKSSLAIAGMLIGLASLTVFACLNPIGHDRMGEWIVIDRVPPEEFIKNFTTHKDRAYWEDIQKQIEDERKNDPKNFSQTNLAVALAHLGKNKDAITILKEVERKWPGLYNTAANLGTVYELNGENENALHWIKEGVKRNSEDHYGTEWLHVKILETKLRLKDEPNWLASNTVLGADVSTFASSPEVRTSVVDHLGQPKTLKEIESALVYQLHERLEFIKPPEPVVADLLTDLSSVFSITRTPEHAQVIYELAKTYGSTRAPISKQPEVPREEPPNESNGLLSLGVATLLFVGMGVVLVTLAGWFYFGKRA